MNQSFLKFCFALAMILFLSACMNLRAYYNLDTDLIESGAECADRLVSLLRGSGFGVQGSENTVLVASFVNIDNLEESSTFGRTVSECISSRLALHGFKVIEMKLRKTVFIQKNAGEFLLSREIKEIGTQHEADIILAGTYSVADRVIYVSARMINPADAAILCSYEYKLPLGNNNLKLLGISDKKQKNNSPFPKGPLGY